MTHPRRSLVPLAHVGIIAGVLGLLLLLPQSSQPLRAQDDGTPAPENESAPELAQEEPSDESVEPEWTPPNPPASKERRNARHAMVRHQIQRARDPVTDPRVLEAMRTVPRHVFVPEKYRSRAYNNTPLPIGHAQTISQPFMVGAMTELLEIEPTDKVLEIGTGSGYQAAVLAQLTPHVYTIEIIEPLAERAAATLDSQTYDTINAKRADGYHGWPEHAPFDAIIVTAAAGHVPPPLWEQLKPGGRMVIPIGRRFEVQRLVLLEKTESGQRVSRSVMPVQFVPFTREQE